MNVVASDVLVIAKDEFTTKNGDVVSSLMMTNGTGQPLKLKCNRALWERAEPLSKKYDVEMNLDTVGYNVYGEILILQEQ